MSLLELHEHEDTLISELDLPVYECVKEFEFFGHPDYRQAPKYLGISRTSGNLSLRADYYVGTAWLAEGNIATIVNPKLDSEGYHIDYPRMLIDALQVEKRHDSDYFSHCYGIDADQKAIPSGDLGKTFLILLILHYFSLLERIVKVGLLRDYSTIEENLKSTMKGQLCVHRNLIKNDLNQRPDRLYCSYQEYTQDVPVNRLLKKALLLSCRILRSYSVIANRYGIGKKISKLNFAFNKVSSDIQEYQIKNLKHSKLYKGYNTAIRVAKMILHLHSDIDNLQKGLLPPFWIDMTGLYEMYVYSLLEKVHPREVDFQVAGNFSTRCDFLDLQEKIIIDAKYKPWYVDYKSNASNLVPDIREISGYARDKKILQKLGISPNTECCPQCLIIYPDQDNGAESLPNHLGSSYKEISEFQNFFTIGIKLPEIKNE